MKRLLNDGTVERLMRTALLEHVRNCRRSLAASPCATLSTLSAAEKRSLISDVV
jgi:hypothetical protein